MLQAVLDTGPLRFAAPRTVDLRLAVPGTAGLRTAAVPPAGLGMAAVHIAAALGIEPELGLAGQCIAQERTAAEQTEALAVGLAQTSEPEALLDVQTEQRIAVLQVLAAGLLAVQLVQLVQSEVQQEPAESLEG